MILDSMIDLITPAFVNLFLFTAALLSVNIIAVELGASWLTGISLIWAAAILLEIFHVIGGLIAAHADHDAYTAL